jgi:cytochrome c551/c552
MGRIKPEATIDKQLNGHQLRGEKWHGAWRFVCPSWPDLAAKHNGSPDALAMLDEFETRAQVAAAEPPKHSQEQAPSLLDYLEASDSVEQQQHLARVSHTIAPAILAFLRERLAAGGRPDFVMADLHAYVNARHPGAPGSPDRVLRDLRQRGECDYEVVSRRASRYRVISVVEAGGGTTEAA